MRHNTAFYFIITFLILCFFTVCSCKDDNIVISNSETEIDIRFNKIWNRYLQSCKGGWQDNELGRLSWDDSYALDGLLAFYKKTNNQKYLDTFVKIASKIMVVDDYTLGKKDKYRGNLSLVGWGSPRYTHDSSHHIFGVTDAMILSPIVNFCNIIKSDNGALQRKYGSYTSGYLDKILKNFEQIQKPDWVDIDGNKGYFQDPYQRTVMINTPLNQFCRVGVLAIELYKATEDKRFLEYAQKLASYLKSILIYEDDYFYWKYWVRTNSSQADSTDDLSHAALVVQFIVTCYENNIVFTKSDINGLVNLFTKKISNSDRMSFNQLIDGKGGIANDISIGYYYLLSPYSKNVYDILSNWYLKEKITLDLNSSFNHFGERLVLTEGYLILYNK